MPDIFVSYSSDDRDRVAPIVDVLENAGWEVWWDRQIDGGAAWEREIEAALDSSLCVVVVWSEKSVQSDWVRTEAAEGLERDILVPVAIDDVRPPLAFRRRQTVDLTRFPVGEAELVGAIDRLVPRALSSRTSSPYIGRTEELQHVRAIADSARRGKGAVVLIGGEAGVGKTRFVEEVCDTAGRAGAIVLTGRCYDVASPPAFGPLVEQIQAATDTLGKAAFRDALGENAPEIARFLPKLRQTYDDIVEPVALSPEHERRYLLTAIVEMFRRVSRTQPVVLVFEDLHWADGSTCALVEQLGEHLRDESLLLIGTYRQGEVAANSAFAALLSELLRARRADDILLERLTRADVAGLVAAHAGAALPDAVIEAIFTQTEGNPFFVEEVCRHLAESGRLNPEAADAVLDDADVPRNVLLVIEQRLQRVSTGCQQALALAAVIGREFEFDVLANASDADAEALLDFVEEGLERALLRDASRKREARYQFEHELIRQTLLNGQSFVRRQRNHQRIADALETFDPTRVREIGEHLYHAGRSVERPRVTRLLTQAGDAALTSSGFDEALRQYDRALEVAAPDDPDGRADLHRRRAQALRGLTRIEDALAALSTALVNGKDTAVVARALADRGRLMADLYRGKEAETDFKRLLELATEHGDAALRLDALEGIARALYILSLDTPGYAEDGLSAMRESMALARELGEDESLARSLIAVGWYVDYHPEFAAEAREGMKEALSLARRIGNEELEVAAQQRLARFATADSTIEPMPPGELEARLQRLRDPVRLNEHYFWMMWGRYHRRQFEACVQACNAGFKVAESIGIPPVMYATIRTMAFTEMARFDEASVSLRDEITDADHRFGAAFQRFGEFLMLAEAGLEERALEVAVDVGRELHALNRQRFLYQMLTVLARMSAIGTLRQQASEVFEQMPPCTASMADVHAWRALAEGDTQAAGAHLDTYMVELHREVPALRLGRAREIEYCIASAAGDWARAAGIASEMLTLSEDWPNMRWRALAYQGLARARAGSGDEEAPLEEARGLLQDLLAVMQDDAFTEAYAGIDLARYVLDNKEIPSW